MAGAVQILPYLLPMLLGRTIDLTNYNIGTNVYDEIGYNEASLKVMNATYHVLRGDSFPYESFGMPMDIVLRIKAGYLSSKSGALGLDGLLSDTSKMHNSAVVAAMVFYQKVQRTLSPNAVVLENWKQRISPNSTHYASSMTYGGWFCVLYRFRCDITSDVSSVYKTLVEVLGESGKLDANAAVLWNKVKSAVESNKQVRGQVRVETRVYSSVNLPVEIYNAADLMKAMKLFPSSIEGSGIPIYMTLKPLSDIDSGFPTVTKNSALANDLKKLDRMWDDVQYSRSHLMRWLQQTFTIFDDDQEERISVFLEKLNECTRLFRLLIADTSLYRPANQEALRQAMDVYKKGLDRGSDSYNLQFLRLKEEIDVTCESSFVNGIKGLLKVFSDEERFVGEVGSGGLEDCKKECLKEDRCRSIGYADTVSKLDEKTGSYISKKNQCWVYYRSTSTAVVESKSGLYGELKVYDRECL